MLERQPLDVASSLPARPPYVQGSTGGKSMSPRARYLLLGLGCSLAAFGFIMALTFIRIKMPSYLHVWSGD
jgi:hypothetical protein